MANRSQRRASKWVMQHPVMRRYAERFARDIAQIMIERFERSRAEYARTGRLDLEFDRTTEELLKGKGAELAATVREIMKGGVIPPRDSHRVEGSPRSSPKGGPMVKKRFT